MSSLDELRSELERVLNDAKQAREQLQQAMLAGEGQITSLALSAIERGKQLEADLSLARAQIEQLQKEASESRESMLGAQARFGDIKTELDQAREQIEGLKRDLKARDEEIESLLKQRADVESERQQARARENQMIQEVRDRETKLVQEVRDREAQLVAAAQAREQQLLAAAKAHEEQLIEDFRDSSEQITALTHLQAEFREKENKLNQALGSAREREAALDAELRVVRGQQAEVRVEIEEQLEAARTELRKLHADLEEQQERQGRAEAHAAELQAVVDSLGRERAALRSEAGAMRAKVELLSAADERARRLAQELDEIRGENEFLNQELARVSSPRQSSPGALPKTPGA